MEEENPLSNCLVYALMLHSGELKLTETEMSCMRGRERRAQSIQCYEVRATAAQARPARRVGTRAGKNVHRMAIEPMIATLRYASVGSPRAPIIAPAMSGNTAT